MYCLIKQLITMKTIYLKSTTKSALIADIAQVIEGYAGEIEFSNGIIHGHYIGQIPNETNPETGEVISWKDGFHANLLVPENFDTSVFSTLVIPSPNNPVHGFA
jgi:hypothetical protein